ncbi:DNA-binding MarR family transcriptional regulator [Nocardia transvalensis]|uniref:DNA-binding MarR family transcriptional regulator n=1 Tax=Nocardia transvalensis TaxID=37333 RepID=A0A7W9PG43_9NOCA|nr:MarR family transcriptional regulator [Nocardia transvalensis]MBB5915043.1 DNA-binding MarR family transcriptional regulator [Nocardia transvalensis]
MVVTACDPGATAAENDVADQLGAQLVRLMRAVGRTKSQLAKHGPDGLERLAYAVLFCLVHDGPQRTGKLAEMLHAETSTISRQTRSLVGHGLVERRADPVDGRACVLAATSEGERVFEENRRFRNHWLAQVLADWPEQDRATLTGLVERLVTGIEKTTATADSNRA